MAGKLEVERKYELPDGFALPDLTGIDGVASIGAADDQRLDAVYYDTAALHLAGARVTLRRRTGGNDAGWHLKRPSGGERSELQIPAAPAPARKAKAARPAKPAAEPAPPAEIIGQVRALTRGQALRPVARIRTHRVERALRDADGGTVALVADDEVATESLHGGRPHRQWHELEVELVDGSRETLDRLDAALRAAGARPAKSPSKLAQALGDDYPAAAGEAPAGSAARRALAGYLRAQRDAIVEQDPAVREGDAEAVHKMRVATRRLRSTLRSFAALLPERAPAGRLDRLHDEVKWLTGLLGPVRDGDVMAERLKALVAAEPPELVIGPVAKRITRKLSSSTATARKALVAGLDGERYTSLLADMDRLVADVSKPGKADKKPKRGRRRLLRRAAKALSRADSRLALARRTAPMPPGGVPALPGQPTRDERLHEARKAYKRARYAVELIAPIAGKRADRLADRLTDLQDVLGAHQDAIVTGNLLRDYGLAAHAAGENAFSYGLLHARQHEHGQAALAGLPKARRRARRAAGWL